MYGTFIQDPIQIEYVNKKLSNHNLLLGAAGTGKTTLAIAKLRQMVMQGIGGRILFVSYTNTLINSCEQENIRKNAQETHLFPVNVEFKTFHKLFFDFYREIYHKSPNVLSKEGDINSKITTAILNCRRRDENNKFIKSPEVFKDEIKYIQRFDIKNLTQYERAPRIGCRVKIIRREDRKYYWAIYEEYKRLLKADGYICDFQGASAVFQNLLQTYYPEGIYDTIIIDEGQDLFPADVKTIVSMLRKNGVLLYVGDATQQIYGSRMTWKSLGLNIRNKVTRLENSYRNTIEIGKFANDIINSAYWDKNASDIMYPQNMQIHGIKPIQVQFDTENEQLYTIKQFLKRHDHETTCIVAFRNNKINEIKIRLEKEKINIGNIRENYPNTSDINVYVCTYHSIKGLEFDNIIIWDLDKTFVDHIPPILDEDDAIRYGQAVKLFYVACTRAKKRVIISSVGSLSEIFPADSKNYQKVEPYELVSVCEKEFSTTKTAAPVNISEALASSKLVYKEEMLAYLQKALKETKEELDIQSPWITERVVDSIFIDKLIRLLANNVTIKILYGIQDDPNVKDKNKRTSKVVEKLRSEFKSYPNFKIQKGNSHAKKLICDSEFCISGSLNWLSYTGQGNRQEEGVLLTDIKSIQTARNETFSF